MKWKYAIDYVVIIVGALFIAVGFNQFLVPHHLISGGVSGISMITSYFTNWNISILYFAFNIPILICGWFLLGKRFVTLSIVSVIAATTFLNVIPIDKFNQEPFLGAVFGGVLIGIGGGISLRVGGSGGGFDIIASIISRFRDFPVGTILIGLNGVVVIALGYMNNNWDLALNSMISIVVTSKLFDIIHIAHVKITLFIISQNPKALLDKLLCLPRGVTIVKTEGAFTHISRDMLITVTTRYELIQLKRIIKEVDPSSFVIIVETAGVIGSFTKRQT